MVVARKGKVPRTEAESDALPDPAEALVAYLAKHKVKATTQTVDPQGKHVGHALLEEATKQNCDLLVMGAYGHSRLREMILGGATREVLAQSTIPVLMAH